MLHVLAHLEAAGLAASCYNPAWIAWARARLGPVSTRPLAEDLHVLTRTALTHDVLARAQTLAWVFASPAEAGRVVDRVLSELVDGDVTSFDALATASSAGPIVEILRAAAELEAPLLAALDDGTWGDALPSVDRALRDVRAAAPSLGSFQVSLARPLGLRGRVHGASIVVGCPGIGCPDAEHAAWQAAHEATVSTLAACDAHELCARRTFLELERDALGTLRSRAEAAGLGDAHARWLARLDLSEIGSIADIDDATD